MIDLESRPRWGILSTRAHLDPGALISDVLLYDRLVFPTPEPDDLKRWQELQWKPDELASCLARLGPLAHSAAWTSKLRKEWKTWFDGLSDLAKEADGIAYGGTPMLIAMSAWHDVQAGTRIPAVPVAAFQTKEEAQAIYAFKPETIGIGTELHRGVALLFERSLAMPVRTAGPFQGMAAFEKAVALSRTKTFQAARRALYDWEDAIVEQKWPVEKAIAELRERMIAHDTLVRAEFSNTVKRRTFRLLAVVGGAAAGMAVAGPAGAMFGALAAEGAKALATEGAEKLVEAGSALFPAFHRGEKAASDPGAALSMAISAVYKQD
jgi:hypothetical protein